MYHTGSDHGLDEVANIAEHNTKALDRVRIACFRLHGLDLHALQHGMLDEAATRLEYAPACCKYLCMRMVESILPDSALCNRLFRHVDCLLS